MTHTASHIIISSLSADVNGKGKVYYYVLGFGLACFIAGALIF